VDNVFDYDRRAPLELPRLRQWTGYLIESYDDLTARGQIGYAQPEIDQYRAALVSAGRAAGGEFKRSLKARIRELLALGVAGYGLSGGVPAGVPLSRPMIVDLAVCSLWPLATVPSLPPAWLEEFTAIIRSAHLASPIVRARYRRRIGDPMSPQEFGQVLSEVKFGWGFANVLRDLADPGRGGGALTAMAIASTRYAPRRGASQQRVARWALRTALAGMTGDRSSDTPATISGWLTHCLHHPRRPYPLPTAPARPQPEPDTWPEQAVPAARNEPWPATLTASPSARPVLIGRR